METASLEADCGSDLPKPRGYCWLPTLKLEAGMVIARPVVGATGSRVTMHLAVGGRITANTIAQLANKGVECVAVVDENPPEPEVYADIVRRYEARLHEIFGPEPSESCRDLLETLIEYGPCQCR